MRLDQSNSLWRSSRGTPSSSAMTSRGSSAATSTTKSHSPLALAASTMADGQLAHVDLQRGDHAGVNPRFTSLR